jgi:hypothetical protein
MSVCPSVRPFFCLSVCSSVHSSACLSIRPFFRLSIHPSVHSSVCLSVRSSVCLSVCAPARPSARPSIFRLSLRPSAPNNSTHTRWNFMKFYIWLFFENLSTKFRSHWSLRRITGTVHDIALYISHWTWYRWILLWTKHVSDKSCRKSQNFMFNNFF